MNVADAIWNRAALENGGPRPRAGDAALSAVLRLHGLAMSGGLLDAVARLTETQLDAAESGYRWLGLPTAGQVVADIRCEVRAGALDDDDRAEILEHEADQRYAEIIPADDTLAGAFRRRLAEEPVAFASTPD
jgi:hypothetical protein